MGQPFVDEPISLRFTFWLQKCGLFGNSVSKVHFGAISFARCRGKKTILGGRKLAKFNNSRHCSTEEGGCSWQGFFFSWNICEYTPKMICFTVYKYIFGEYIQTIFLFSFENRSTGSRCVNGATSHGVVAGGECFKAGWNVSWKFWCMERSVVRFQCKALRVIQPVYRLNCILCLLHAVVCLAYYISISSPRQLFLIMRAKNYGMKASQQDFITFWKQNQWSHGW